MHRLLTQRIRDTRPRATICLLLSGLACCSNDLSPSVFPDGGASNFGADGSFGANDAGEDGLWEAPGLGTPGAFEFRDDDPGFLSLTCGVDGTMHRARGDKVVRLLAHPDALVGLTYRGGLRLSRQGDDWAFVAGQGSSTALDSSGQPENGASMGSPVHYFVHQDELVRVGLPGSIEFSRDARAWRRRALPDTVERFDIGASLNGALLGHDPKTGLIWRLVGDRWRASSRPSPLESSLVSFGFDGENYFAVGPRGFAITSKDLDTWVAEPAVIASTAVHEDLTAVTVLGKDWIVLGSSGSIFQVSTAGGKRVWLKRLSPDDVTLNSVETVANTVVAIGTDRKTGEVHAFLSSDGISWTRVPKAAFSETGKPVQVITFKGQLYLLDDVGGIFRSPNGGLSWLLVSKPTTPLLTAVFTNGTFVVAGEQGLMFYSRDGLAWTQATLPAPGASSNEGSVRIAKVRFVSKIGTLVDKFVALTNHGLFVSDNGAQWSEHETKPALRDAEDVACGANGATTACLVVTSTGLVYSSPDLVNWSKIPGSAAPTASANVGFWKNRFIVESATDGTFLQSLDLGTTWTSTKHSARRLAELASLTPGERHLVAFGEAFHLTRPDGSGSLFTFLNGTKYESQYLLSGKSVATLAVEGGAMGQRLWAVGDSGAFPIAPMATAAMRASFREDTEFVVAFGALPGKVHDAAVGMGRMIVVGEGELLCSFIVPK